MAATPLLATNLPGIKPHSRGKVRDIYDLGDNLLIVATDRVSVFDVVLPNGVPDKGAVLTQISAFWFKQTEAAIRNHLISANADEFPAELSAFADQLRYRSMVVKKVERVDIECVVRGYLAGSAWAEYRKSGTVCGETLATGLRESEQLPEPIFTPSTKAATGHDENISIRQLRDMVGVDLANRLAEKSLEVYGQASKMARERGIIIADTKMEFGLVEDELILIDELLTPDSSRFWDVTTYRVGESQPSFDKQLARDCLANSGWNKEPPAPELPADIVEKTHAKYIEAYSRIVSKPLFAARD